MSCLLALDEGGLIVFPRRETSILKTEFCYAIGSNQNAKTPFLAFRNKIICKVKEPVFSDSVALSLLRITVYGMVPYSQHYIT